MAERKDPILSDEGRELIRVMAIAGANINRIRAALRAQEGLWFSDDPIIEAASQFGLAIVQIHNAGAAKTETGTAATDRLMLLSLRPKREADKVRIIAPGTYPVPKGGYRIGGQSNG